ncbi:hypothetical protein ABIE89_000433 [Bradyrhizobium niftali]
MTAPPAPYTGMLVATQRPTCCDWAGYAFLLPYILPTEVRTSLCQKLQNWVWRFGGLINAGMWSMPNMLVEVLGSPLCERLIELGMRS